MIHAAEQVQRARDHALHLVEIGVEALAHRRIVERFGAQLEPRERRAQIVRHRRQHARAAVEIAMQPLLHGVERACRFAQLARARLAQRHTRAAPDGFGRRREVGQRTGNRARHDVQNRAKHERNEAELEQQRQRQRRCSLRRVDTKRHDVAVGQGDGDVELARRAARAAAGTAAAKTLVARLGLALPGLGPARRRAEIAAPGTDVDRRRSAPAAPAPRALRNRRRARARRRERKSRAAALTSLTDCPRPSRRDLPRDDDRLAAQTLELRGTFLSGQSRKMPRRIGDRRHHGGRIAARKQRVAPLVEQQRHDDHERHADHGEHRGQQPAEQRVRQDSALHAARLSTGTPMM